ncbi:MAG: sigma-70 family RNA polymerase sigma factor [Prevotella sp.]|jgi:RNA polymerase sigma-70 factor (ECF subfamily)|uniref:Sigma-70 family RNA polymerase sigma factor n=1 Tax=Segatella cerevisiae TaxID=2053716 RepID=A0ABT1BXX2_9BACT|nr:sigma-70 family RNA polymerase sigma factor [Segatella cerevisiae]MCH3995337.1 sigma-70 family RNA polymerase sigma factor [Prevotella sp.]MCI1246592.1 sigma-70 family RNA polymerase sigma factor [Prevotella sp.]MCO6025906.1 sigma-70 family RNA polymerase sigma factor [Segatella cerevisiae]
MSEQNQPIPKHLEDMSDEELAMSYVAGNNRAFDLLLSRNQSSLFSYILFWVGDQNVADDVFQETFVKVIRKLHEGKYASSGKFGAWCIRIAHNVIIDWYRRKKTRKIVDTLEGYDFPDYIGDTMAPDNIENDIMHHQVMHDIKNMIELLPPVQREVVFLRYYQKLTFKQISVLTNVSINTSLGRMRYALVNLRKMVKDYHLELQLK